MTTVAFCCDLGQRQGTGHVMRCLALAEELGSRSVECVVIADFDSVAWARGQVVDRGLRAVHARGVPDAWRDALELQDPDAVVIDSYAAPQSFVAESRRDGSRPVLAIVDEGPRDLVADLYLNQNLGAQAGVPETLADRVLAGARFALMRDEVLRHRPETPSEADPSSPPIVLAYFGGTDAYAAGPVVATALAETGEAFDATFVAPRPELRSLVDHVGWRTGQSVRAIDRPDSLMSLVARADLVISASGTSLGELMCLGSATAVTAVVANQVPGYELAASLGLVDGIGHLDDIRGDPSRAATRLRNLLRDHHRRTQLRRRGWTMVDGEGRRRVADSLLTLMGSTLT